MADYCKKLWVKAISICAMVISVTACNPGGTTTSSPESGVQPSGNGTLSFNYSGNLQVSKGSTQLIYLTLSNSSSAQTMAASSSTQTTVTVTTTDPTVATVSPSSCQLSTTTPRCALTVYGIATGSTSLQASAPGYPTITLSSTTVNGPVFGSFAVESSLFASSGLWSLESTAANESINVSFSSYAAESGYYTAYVTGGLLNSSGLVQAGYTGSNAPIFGVDPSNPSSQNIYTGVNPRTLTPQSCIITFNPFPVCTIVLYIPKSAVDSKQPITLYTDIAGSISSDVSNSPIILNFVGDSNAYPGQINVLTQTSLTNTATIPESMNAPIFVDWTDVAINGTVGVTLTSSDTTKVKFYNYESGNNVAPQYSSTASCTLTYPPTSTQPLSGLSCGFGVTAVGQGSATITAAYTTTLKPLPAEATTLNLTVGPQAGAIRTVLFTNSSSESVVIAVTQGGATSYAGPQTPSQIAGSPSATNVSSGGQCGLSNPLAACPIGSTCVQGGSVPESGPGFSQYQCFYDQPSVTCGSNCFNNYQLLSGGTATLTISGSSGESDPRGIIWSGNYYARTNCNPTTGVCENGSCYGQGGGLVCGPGVGGSPGVATLAEETFARSTVGPDYYDVSVINGVNVGAAFGPVGISPTPATPYNCGLAGDSESQGNSPDILGAASWNVTPNNNSFPVAVTESLSYYTWVEYAIGQSTCNSSADCSGSNKCGYLVNTSFNNIPNESSYINSPSANYTKYCGMPIAWLTADEIYGFNSAFPSNAESPILTLPFNFESVVSTTGATPPPATTPFVIGNLQLCNNGSYSSYQPQPGGSVSNMACGGVNWTDVPSYGYITWGTADPTTVGTPWVNNVLPTITWLKQTCPTCYSYPFDDVNSTFTCQTAGTVNYAVTFTNPPPF